MMPPMAPRRGLILLLALLPCLAFLPSAQAGGGGLPAWGVEPAPNVDGVLNGISVGAHNDIWAVGYNGGEVNPQTLTMHFDGSAWTVVPSPNLPDGNRLEDVVTLSPTDAWAVGATPPRSTAAVSRCTGTGRPGRSSTRRSPAAPTAIA